MGAMTRTAWIAAITAGLAAGAVTDLLLVATGTATLAGAQAGVITLPLLFLTARPSVRRALSDHSPVALVALGAAWTLAPLIDQHLTGVVVVDGAFADLVHHTAGWAPLLVGAQLIHRPKPSVTP